jgi:hypothetical protein
LVGRTEQGQTKPVYVKKLIYKEGAAFISVEEEILALQGHKSIVCSKVLNDERIEKQIPVKRTNDKISILGHQENIPCLYVYKDVNQVNRKSRRSFPRDSREDLRWPPRQGSHVGCQRITKSSQSLHTKPALDRMKKEGKKHLTKVFKPKKGKFALQPKEGTAGVQKEGEKNDVIL